MLTHILFVLNFLTLDYFGKSAAERHWHPETKEGYATAIWKDTLIGRWNGPEPVLIWGKGSACVFDNLVGAARWLPERLIKPFCPKEKDKNKKPNFPSPGERP